MPPVDLVVGGQQVERLERVQVPSLLEVRLGGRAHVLEVGPEPLEVVQAEGRAEEAQVQVAVLSHEEEDHISGSRRS